MLAWFCRPLSLRDVNVAPFPLGRGDRGGFIVSCAACATLLGCASAAAYDPDHLGTARVTRIAEICQTTLGLSPKEPPVLGVYLGSPHLDREVSHYQVCIASLSDSVLDQAEQAVASEAHRQCRDKGLSPGSEDLAVCILQRVEADSQHTVASAFNGTVMREEKSYQSRPVQSFFYASPRETRHRVELACARLGLEPPYGDFAKCVKLMNNNFYAIDNPIT